VKTLLDDFKAVSLDETNRLAQMLNRVDNKYVADFEQFAALLNSVSDQYAVLEIDGRNEFQYASCYYDDDFSCYFQHHQARRQRIKVRTREYVNSGLMFFEVKLKGLRGRTDKHRIGCDTLVMPQVQGEYLAMLNDLYASSYKKTMPFDLRPSLLVEYARCTLVALRGGERVTIDFDLRFAQPNSSDEAIQIGHDFIIVETKSADGRGISDAALKQLGVRKTSKCSKYCIGVNLTGDVTKNNNFLHTIRHVRKNIVSKSHCALAVSK
jgi:hypothetical protein